jgi:hypothetical protein
MAKITTVYLDMDGVLSDFMSRYRQVSDRLGLSPEGVQSQAWTTFCEEGHFANLDTWPGWSILVHYIDQLAQEHGFTVEILTSTGGRENHERVAADKESWCRTHGLTYKVNAVPGRWTKRDWAAPDRILIDDTLDVVEGFRAAGGLAILHQSVWPNDAVDGTLRQLEKMLDNQ